MTARPTILCLSRRKGGPCPPDERIDAIVAGGRLEGRGPVVGGTSGIGLASARRFLEERRARRRLRPVAESTPNPGATAPLGPAHGVTADVTAPGSRGLVPGGDGGSRRPARRALPRRRDQSGGDSATVRSMSVPRKAGCGDERQRPRTLLTNQAAVRRMLAQRSTKPA